MYVQTIYVYICPMQKAKNKYCNCLYYSASALARIMTKKADEHFATTGLTSSYALVLMSVADQDKILAGEIAEEVQLSPSTVSRFLDKMEIKGLISREQCGRNTYVSITEEGKKLIPKVKKAWKALYNDYTSLVGEEETKALTSCMNEAMEKLE